MADNNPQSDDAISSLLKRLPVGRWQTVDVKFTAAFTDTTVAHTLSPIQPGDVRFYVVDQQVGGVVFRGVRSPQKGYIVLQTNVPGTYRLELFVEANVTPGHTLPASSNTPNVWPAAMLPGFTLANLTDVTRWTDMSGNTFTGFTSFTHKSVQYFKLDKMVVIHFLLAGVLSSGTPTMSIAPFTTVNSDLGVSGSQYNAYDGAFQTGEVATNGNDTVLHFYKDNATNPLTVGPAFQFIGYAILHVQ